MKPKTLLGYFLLLVFLGVAILVHQSDSNAGNAVDIGDCVQLKEGDVGELSGLLILESRTDDQPSYVLDLATGEKSDLPNVTVNSIVGPSKAGLLTYFDYEDEAWVIKDLSGDFRLSMSELGSATPIAWLDGERLLIGTDRLVALDLLSDRAEPVLSDSAFAQIYNEINWSSPLNWGGFSAYRIVPNMDSRYLAYAANGEPGTLLVLWDEVNKQEIAGLHWVDPWTPPQWAPDRKSLITSAPPFVLYGDTLFTNIDDELPYVGGNELLQMEIDGSVRRLTTFTKDVNAIESGYRWSPDGEHLVFTLESRSDDSKTYHVAILDIEPREVRVFCLPQGLNHIVGFPVWSPDGEKIALTLAGDDLVLKVYIVDAKSGDAKSIGVDVQAVGWWGD